jgi:hypothetical protein
VKALFSLGQVVATPGAITIMERCGIQPGDLLRRHVTGDWGTVHPEDEGINDQALRDGERLLSVYGTETEDQDNRLWVITEWDRSVTTILRPEDY